MTGSQHGPKVQVLVSKDLEHWDTYTARPARAYDL